MQMIMLSSDATKSLLIAGGRQKDLFPMELLQGVAYGMKLISPLHLPNVSTHMKGSISSLMESDSGNWSQLRLDLG